MNKLILSIVIPAYNEEKNIGPTIEEIKKSLDRELIPYEIIIVNDNSSDKTKQFILEYIEKYPCIRIVDRTLPGGFGRAIRSGIEAVKGDVVIVYMADLSDRPEDVVSYYRKIEEGYDCVFGSRFMRNSKVENYPPLKLLVNRLVNKMIQLLFWTKFNDLTNAFKAYRTSVIHECGPYYSSHFNITIEMSLSALVRKYSIIQIPISWHGRTWGSSNLRLSQMGRRYLSTLLKIFFEKLLISDDLIAERLRLRSASETELTKCVHRIALIEERVIALEKIKVQ
jgi:dolichol-phosphate mannosyltransferase